MNHLIFTAVLTACLGIGGYQQGPEFFGPSPEGLGHYPHYDPGQLNSSYSGSWPPLVSLHFTLSIVVYTSMYYVLTYFAGSFRRYNFHAKVFCWLMTIYLIITALTGFQFAKLLPYLLQVVPSITGYYTNMCLLASWTHFLWGMWLVRSLAAEWFSQLMMFSLLLQKNLLIPIYLVLRETVLNYLGACFGHDQSFKYSASSKYIFVDVVGAEVCLPGLLGCGLVEYVSKDGRALVSHFLFNGCGQKTVAATSDEEHLFGEASNMEMREKRTVAEIYMDQT
ncbi:hypothetical protein DSO57_1017987 [Entomophthora muscae]|uniref:Uncharacterized protein n=1 Tax=Entomophthora muscae TaxID=34485 RepID=A0ACC2U2S9_9FUNG|nr:hypothetical protein DSO57_1017987 [Entomophthora muscae]